MSVIYLLILLSLSMAIIFLIAFLWAVRSGQYEDDYSPSVRLLMEDEPHLNDEDISKTNA